MDALEVTGNAQSFADERWTLPQNTVLTKLRVTARVTQVVPTSTRGGGGVLLNRGESTISVNSADVDGLMEQVWDKQEPDRIQTAADNFERTISEEVSRQLDKRDDQRVHAIYEATRDKTRAEVEDMYRGDPESLSIYTLRHKQYARTGHSVEAAFRKLYYRGIKPIVSAKVIEEGVQPAELARANFQTSQVSEALLSKLASVLGQGRTQEIEDLKAEVAELRSLLDDATTPRGKSKG